MASEETASNLQEDKTEKWGNVELTYLKEVSGTKECPFCKSQMKFEVGWIWKEKAIPKRSKLAMIILLAPEPRKESKGRYERWRCSNCGYGAEFNKPIEEVK